MKTYWGGGDTVPYVLDLGTRSRWVVSFMPWPLYPQGKSPQYPLNRRLGRSQRWWNYKDRTFISNLDLKEDTI